MSTAYAVIGAGFGDEGKGLTTDYLTRRFSKIGQQPPVVVRCNGGAQAGHTVVDGARRHVFGHFGAGTFAGAATYLGSNFIVNPLIFEKEKTALRQLDTTARVYAHAGCRVTTIFDMALNSLVELHRGSQRHGSCGMGINETVVRHDAKYGITIEMAKELSIHDLSDRLEVIRRDWVKSRLAALGLPATWSDWSDNDTARLAKIYYTVLASDPKEVAIGLRRGSVSIGLGRDWLDQNWNMDDEARSIPAVIEGAQGLALDEFLGTFPHVTRSITGLPSHCVAARECGFTEVQPIYVTRAYQTRHGAGPLRFEGANITDKFLVDETNVDNDWQGSLRFAPLDLSQLGSLISQDVGRAEAAAFLVRTNILEPKIVVTCMDQLGDRVNIIHMGVPREIDTCNLIDYIEDCTGIDVVLTSHGPTAADVRPRGNVVIIVQSATI